MVLWPIRNGCWFRTSCVTGFNVPVVGTSSLTLDDHTFDPFFKHHVSPSPIFTFYAPNIDVAYKYVKEKGIVIVREMEWVEDTA